MKQNILVFPCGSEVGLEIYRSLEGSIHFELFGASSVEDHGRFVFERYIGGLPFVTDIHFIPALREIVLRHRIDAIYPSHGQRNCYFEKKRGGVGLQGNCL